MKRIVSVDIVRGLIMVFMALDHVRDYVSRDHFAPENLARGTAMLFATRWITHFCAPGFFLLAGAGIGISRGRGATPAQLSRFLFTRGIWLLVLDVAITPILWQFDWPPVPVLAIVLWGLGCAMILMALLVHLPWQAVLAVSLLIIFGHNLLDGVKVDQLGAFGPLWSLVHGPGFLIPGKLLVVYPPVPWGAVMALGYVMARLYQETADRRRMILVMSGVGAIVLFMLLRSINGYGNPFPWSEQRTPALTVASFLNVTKQPPSLQFLLMTLGPIALMLAFTENARGRFGEFLATYGRVPLFYYVLHIFVAHLVALPLAYVQGGEWLRLRVLTDIGDFPEWFGVGLPGVYAFWILVVLLLYYPCRWWGRLKATRDEWWLRYL